MKVMGFNENNMELLNVPLHSPDSHLTICYASRHKTGRVISAEGIGISG